MKMKHLLIGKMFSLRLVVFLALMVSADPHEDFYAILDDTVLELAFMIHRHGDRTPIEDSLVFSNNPAALMQLSEPYGWGQLTNVGIQRSFDMGEEIRNRYDSLLGPRYNSSEVYIRSTDSTRAKMTILAALAAIYPPGSQPWNPQLKWQPVPYTTVPAKYDFNLANINCPKLMNFITALSVKSSPAFEPYSEVLELLSRKIGFDFTTYPIRTYLAYDLYISQLSLGLPLDPEIQENFPEIQKIAELAIDVLGNNAYTPLGTGVLLNEFLTNAKAVVDGEHTQRIRIYSAHDITVYSFEAITQIANRQGVPKYSTIYSLELRRVTSTGEFVVIPVYIPSPGEDPVYLQVSGCGQPCSLMQFVNITSPYAKDEDTWRSDCGFTPDIIINDSFLV